MSECDVLHAKGCSHVIWLMRLGLAAMFGRVRLRQQVTCDPRRIHVGSPFPVRAAVYSSR